MRKAMMGVTIACLAMFAMSSVASANFVQPVGTSATLTGSLGFAMNILTARCAMSFAGRVASATTLSVTSGSGSCNVGGLTPTSFPWTQTIDLAGNWSIGTIRRTVAVPMIGNCVYEGTLGGTYESDGEMTILTITDSASSVAKTSGSSLCTSDPTIAGDLEVTVGIL